MLCPCPYMETNDDSYHMPVWIGIGISIGKISSSVLGIKTLEKCGIGPPLVIILSPDPSSQHLPINTYYRHTHIWKDITVLFCRCALKSILLL